MIKEEFMSMSVLNEVFSKINTFAYNFDLVITKTVINPTQEWVECIAIDHARKIKFNFNVSKYGLFYYNDGIYTLEEMISGYNELYIDAFTK